MAKIPFDKYYTPPTVARWCIEKTKEVIGEENITEWFEPSAGSGSFSHQLEGCRAYDLYPQHEYIEQADFLELELEYKRGRCFIGNPPFGGSAGKILKGFYDKCCEFGDYIAFIQPAAYYWNYKKFFKFEIVYSCLIKTEYTNHNLWTSFTIYKRNPIKNDFRDRIERTELRDVTFTKIGRKNAEGAEHKKNLDYDYCFSSFGTIFSEKKPYETAGQILVKINNESLREEIMTFMKWIYYEDKRSEVMSRKCVGSKNVDIEDLKKIMKICIPKIK